MSALQSLENSLNDLFVKKAPALPASGKKTIVTYLPWINLVLGSITLFMAYGLWHWAHAVNALIDYANSLSTLYGGQLVATSRMSFMVWLALVALIAEALLFIAAFPATRDHKKQGWNLMFYALLVNIVYAILNIFTDYGGSYVISSLLGVAIGLYFLFQIRDSYKQ